MRKSIAILFNLSKRIYSKMERFIIMYVPFISSIMFFIHMILYVNEVQTIFYNINADISGHSILWLWAFYIRSKTMCKWYKLSIITAMLSHVFNFMYYKNMIDIYVFMNLGMSIAIVSIILFVFFLITYRTSKKIHSMCKDLEKE